EATEKVMAEDKKSGATHSDHRFFGLTCMFFGSLWPVIEGWHHVKEKSERRDAEIDHLLTSRYVDTVREFQNCVFHYNRYNDERLLAVFDFWRPMWFWARDLHVAVSETFAPMA